MNLCTFLFLVFNTCFLINSISDVWEKGNAPGPALATFMYAFLSPLSHMPSRVNSKTITLFILICHLFQETHTVTSLTSSKTLSWPCARQN